jgi:toxin CcdB
VLASRRCAWIASRSGAPGNLLGPVSPALLQKTAAGSFADRLKPRIEIDGQPFVLIAQELVTVRKSVLGNARESIAGERDAVIAALDLLFTGF